VIVAVVLLSVLGLVLVLVIERLVRAMDRMTERNDAERRHLTNAAIARHAGEIRMLDAGIEPSTERPERPVPIEGLN
jgi:hypothetical protein